MSKKKIFEWLEWIAFCVVIGWSLIFAVMAIYLWHNSTLVWLIRFGGEWWR